MAAQRWRTLAVSLLAVIVAAALFRFLVRIIADTLGWHTAVVIAVAVGVVFVVCRVLRTRR